jgi:hypothetical protein
LQTNSNTLLSGILQTISFIFRLGHSTVQGIVQDVCKSVIKHLKHEVMPTPTQTTWSQIVNDFWDLWNFPNCIGAIDGKHVKLQAPPHRGSKYFNYEHSFSVVLLALVDTLYKFTVVDIGSYGRNSAGGIFAHSKLGKHLETHLGIPENKQLPRTTCSVPHVIVGDEACPLKSYLMRHYPGSQSKGDNEKSIFNYRLSRATRVVENAFGILSQKF